MTSPALSHVPLLFRWNVADGLNGQQLLARSFSSEIAGVLARTSTKYVTDKNGLLIPLPQGMPPLAWIGGEPVMLLEPARTNLFLRSQEFDSATWLKAAAGAGSNPSVTANAGVAPDGSSTADRVQFATNGSTTADRSILRQSVTVTAADHAMSFWVKSNTGLTFTLVFHWEGGSIGSFSVTPTWSRVSLSRAAAAATSPFGIEARGATNGSSETADILLWQGQLELGAVESSEIKTEGTTVTRSADSLYFPIGFGPRALTAYVRGVSREIGTNTGTGRVNLVIGSSTPSADPRFILYGTGAGNIGGEYDDGTTIRASTPLPSPLAAVGSLVEQRATLSASGFFQAGVSIAGGAEVLGTSNGPNTFPANWNQARIYLTGGLTSLNIQHAYTHIAIAAGEQSMDTMRALAGV